MTSGPDPFCQPRLPVRTESRRFLATALRWRLRVSDGFGFQGKKLMSDVDDGPAPLHEDVVEIEVRIAQPVRVGIEKGVQRLLDRAANDPVQMPFDPLVIDPDSRCWVAPESAYPQKSPSRSRQLSIIVRKKLHVIQLCQRPEMHISA